MQAGPSNPLLKKKQSAATPTPKRKRTDTPEGTSAGSPSPQPARKPRDGPKKKKANRACYHCQKAHLTCDDCEFSITLLSLNLKIPLARPCQRCVKRGFANNCTEGHRKKAKYLLDEEELGTLRHYRPSFTFASRVFQNS
jgi:hypothetical protein